MARRLIGRHNELATTGRFLDCLETGPAALVLEGEAGIGKTTLLQQAVRTAENRSYRLLACRPVEIETKLSFAGLADLLAGQDPEVVRLLPGPQRRALEVALLLEEPGFTHDHRAISVAFSTLLTTLAAEEPVVIAVDDARWLDRASSRVLQFAIRRLGSHRVGILTSMRVPDETEPPLGMSSAIDHESLYRVVVGPLSVAETHGAIETALGWVPPRPLLLRIHRTSGGNPFFALELASELRRRGGHADPSQNLPLPTSLGKLVEARIKALSPGALEVLAVASALADATPQKVRAITGPNCLDFLEDARAAGVIEIEDAHIRFTHPLLAAAISASMRPEEKARLHRRLAVLATAGEPRARHLALGAESPDETLAAILDEAAAGAQARGAPEAAVELAEYARSLTPPDDADAMCRRAVRAARYQFSAGDAPAARSLLEQTIRVSASGPDRAGALRLLGEIRYQGDSAEEGTALLRQALKEAAGDPALMTAIHLLLAHATMSSGDMRGAEPQALAALLHAESSGQANLLAQALAVLAMARFLVGKGVATDDLRRALALENPADYVSIWFRPSLIEPLIVMWTGRLVEAGLSLAALHARMVEAGDVSAINVVCFYRAQIACWTGDFPTAMTLAEESAEIAAETGDEGLPLSRAIRALVYAHLGLMEATRCEAAGAMADLQRSGAAVWRIWPLWALGLLELSLGNLAAVHATLGPLTAALGNVGLGEPMGAPFLADEAEALVGLGDLAGAETIVHLLETQGHALDRAWALAAGYRCRALLCAVRGDFPAAMAALSEALIQHGRLAMPFELARTLLVAGRIQRRAKEKLASKTSLSQALAVFESLGTPLWAAQARAELGRVGSRAAAPGELTSTEARIATLVAGGSTNNEVAALLFISIKTVEANLSRIYAKLGVRSRSELAARAAQQAPGDVPDHWAMKRTAPN